MTATYFASAGVLYAQEGGRCAKLVTRAYTHLGATGYEDRWEAVPVPDMAALFPTREAVPVADAWKCPSCESMNTSHRCPQCDDEVPVADDVRYGTWTGGGRDTWRCECRTHYLLNDYQDHCHDCGTHRPA